MTHLLVYHRPRAEEAIPQRMDGTRYPSKYGEENVEAQVEIQGISIMDEHSYWWKEKAEEKLHTTPDPDCHALLR